jgi:hypothetical protein
MNRRDFLRFKSVGQRRVAELSCERLYMRVVDAQRVSASSDGADRWDGEPAPVFDVSTTDELFAGLDRELRDAQVIRVIAAEWLASGDLRARLDAVLDAFRARGGRVDGDNPQ